MEKLLTQTWNNALLADMFQGALMTARADRVDDGKVLPSGLSQSAKSSAIFLFDHTAFLALGSNLIVVRDENPSLCMIFLSKDTLVDFLNAAPMPSKEHVSAAVGAFLNKAISASQHPEFDGMLLSRADFSTWLSKSRLDHIAESLGIADASATSRSSPKP